MSQRPSQPSNVGGIPYANGSGVMTEHSGNQTVHVRENSDSTLDQLFDVVKNSAPNKQSDWTRRNLPTSFFTQPQVSRHLHSGNHEHNRNSSQDSAQFGILLNGGLQPPVQHIRSRSAPVSLSQMTLPPQTPVHVKQQSVDLVEDMGGWNPANIQQYDFSQSNQSWMNTPNKAGSASALNQSSPQQQQSPSPALSPSHSLSPVSSSMQSVIGPLPQGWEMSITPEGEIYYINHIDKSTSWFHPTMSTKNHPGPIKLAQLHPTQQNIVQRHIQEQQALAAAAAAATVQQQQVAPSPQPQQGALPPQMVSPIQRTGAVLGSPQAGGGASGDQGSNVGGASSSASQVNETYIMKELQKLHMQKKQLQRQQEEISKRERLLQRGFTAPSTPLVNGGACSSVCSINGIGSLPVIMEAPETLTPNFPCSTLTTLEEESQLTMLTKPTDHPSPQQQQPTSVMGDTQQQPPPPPPLPQQQPPNAIQSTDPFLGQAHSASDAHARQNSADSGLEGMGTGYSLPRTPEDFLTNVDEMDSSETGHKMQKGQGSDFNMNEMEGLGMDMSNSMETHTTPMDEHELVPTLQEDIGSELLEGIEGQKIENLLTWL